MKNILLLLIFCISLSSCSFYDKVDDKLFVVDKITSIGGSGNGEIHTDFKYAVESGLVIFYTNKVYTIGDTLMIKKK